MVKQSYRKGVVFTILAGVLWSTVGLGIRMIEEAGVWQILMFRSVSLSLFLLIVILIRSKENPFRLIIRNGLIPYSLGALGLFLAYSGAIFSIQKTSVANAMLLFATAPFMAAVLGRFLLHEKVKTNTWVLILVGLLGVIIMMSDKLSSVAFFGSVGGIFSALGFAIFTVALRWGKSVEMLPMVFLSGLFSIIITGLICFIFNLSILLTKVDYFICLGMGVIQVGAGLVLYTIGSRSIPAAELTLLAMAEVLLGPFWVWLVLGETFSFSTLVGGMVLLAAIVGNALFGMRKKPFYYRTN